MALLPLTTITNKHYSLKEFILAFGLACHCNQAMSFHIQAIMKDLCVIAPKILC